MSGSKLVSSLEFGEAVKVAEATGLHRNTISNLEVGRYAGDPETLALIRSVWFVPASN